MYRMVFQEGPLKGRRLTVEQGQVRLGSAPDCSVRLPGGGLPTRVRVEARDAGRFRLQDLSATPGLRVNGTLTHEADVGPGDRIQIGDHGFRLEPLAPGTPQRLRLRRTSSVQRATVAAVAVILGIQILLVAGFSMLQRSPLTDTSASEPETAVETSRSPVVPSFIPEVVLPAVEAGAAAVEAAWPPWRAWGWLHPAGSNPAPAAVPEMQTTGPAAANPVVPGIGAWISSPPGH